MRQSHIYECGIKRDSRAFRLAFCFWLFCHCFTFQIAPLGCHARGAIQRALLADGLVRLRLRLASVDVSDVTRLDEGPNHRGGDVPKGETATDLRLIDSVVDCRLRDRKST